MDDQDQIPLTPSEEGARPKKARRKKPVEPQEPELQELTPAQTAEILAEELHEPQTTGSLGDQTLYARPASSGEQTQLTGMSPTRQLTRPQVQLPQPILFLDQAGDVLVEEELPARPQRLLRVRRWFRSRTGRVVIPLLTLLLGVAIGLTSIVWYGLSGEGPLVTVVPAQGNFVIDANKSFVSQLVINNLTDAGIPGHVQNVTVTLKHGALIVLQGEDVYPVLFTSVTRPFTVDIQPYTQNCVLQVRITHADFSGIPVTTFVQSFQNQINQQLAVKPTGLPEGFTYCTVGVNTEPGGMYIIYQATPIKH